MSKFTTQVRFICETAAGFDESKGYGKVNVILNACANIVMPNYPIFDEEYRKVLNTKILKHFYTREIGLETVGLWKLKMDERMNLIMPRYNKLYLSAQIEFDPLHDIDLTTDKKTETSGDTDGESNKNGSENVTDNGARLENISRDSKSDTNTETITAGSDINKTVAKQVQKYSDTPQGGLQNVESGAYLTNATIDDKDGSGNSASLGSSQSDGSQVFDEGVDTSESTVKQRNGNTSENSTNNSHSESTEDYLEHIVGKRGLQSMSKMLMEYRDTLINIDLMIINELEDLFFGLWE